MKSKTAIIISIILAFFVSGASIKVQAQVVDSAPECMLKATRDFKIVVGPVATLEVKRGEEFVGKIYPGTARIKISGAWYEVSRNDVMLSSWHVPGKED